MRILLFLVFLIFISLGVAYGDRTINYPKCNPSPPPGKVYIYELGYANSLSLQNNYEHTQAVSALAGLVNRLNETNPLDAPELLYLYYTDSDKYWLDYMISRGNWISKQMTKFSTFSDHDIPTLFQTFRDYYNGVVLYDPNVFATSLAASTAAGVYDLIPIAKRSERNGTTMYDMLVTTKQIPVVLDLTTMGFKTKSDVYSWAIQEFVVSERSNPRKMAYYLDYFWTTVGSHNNQHSASNHDYFISHRGFFFDLDIWDDEHPIDDPTQPEGTDFHNLIDILSLSYEQRQKKKSADDDDDDEFLHIGGFVPWAFKYCNKHEPVASEWRMVEITSAFDAFIDADALSINAMANAAFFCHFPLDERYYPEIIPDNFPTRQWLMHQGFLEADGKTVVPRSYVSFYSGDWDSAAWFYQKIASIWNDSARGSVPIGWPFDPTLSLRFPVGFDMVLRTRNASSDYLMAGDSGAGYINPSQLIPPRKFSNVGSGVEAFRNHCTPLYNKFNIAFTGFLLNGAAGPDTTDDEEIYAAFSADGVNSQGFGSKEEQPHVVSGYMPVTYLYDLPLDIGQAVAALVASIEARGGKGNLQFLPRRLVLKSPQFFSSLMSQTLAQTSADDVAFVTPYVMGLLIKFNSGDYATIRVGYPQDTIPRRMQRGKQYDVGVLVHNRGFKTLNHKSHHILEPIVTVHGSIGSSYNFELKSEFDIHDGMNGWFNGTLSIPSDFAEIGKTIHAHYGCVHGDDSCTKWGNPDWSFFVEIK